VTDDSIGCLTNESDVILGNKIKIRRKYLGISQQDLADIVGLTSQQVQKYEMGANKISVPMLMKICEALKVNAEYFLSENASHQFKDISDHKTLDDRIDAVLLRSLKKIQNKRLKASILELLIVITNSENE
jgi:transcriptional regulator with XRE-family HTH domain